MKIKFDKIMMDVREDDSSKFDKPISIMDNFSISNNEWETMGPYVGAAKTISGGVLSINSPSNYNVGAWKNRQSSSRNSIIDVDFVGSSGGTSLSSTHRVHCRESQNYYAYTSMGKDSGALTVAKNINNTVVSLGSSLGINGYNKSKTYKTTTKCYENHISIIAQENGKVMASVGCSHSDILALTSNNNGLCGAGIAIYDNYKSQQLRGFVNIVALGDSITLGYLLNQEDNCSNYVNASFADGPVFMHNKGVSGNKCADVTARLATDLTAYKVTNAKNICVLLIGSNDILTQSAADTFIAWNTLASGIIAAGFELWACTVTPRNGETANNTTIRAFNDLLKQSNKPKVLIDLYSAVINPIDDNNSIAGYMQADGRHLTAMANQKWANLIKTEILNVYPSIDTGLMNCDKAFVKQIATKSVHPTSYKPVFQDTDTKELYIFTG